MGSTTKVQFTGIGLALAGYLGIGFGAGGPAFFLRAHPWLMGVLLVGGAFSMLLGVAMMILGGRRQRRH